MFNPACPTPTKCSQIDVSHGRKHCVNMGTTDIDEESFIHAPGGAGWGRMVWVPGLGWGGGRGVGGVDQY